MILLHLLRQTPVVLVLLGLTAALDTVEQTILLFCLNQYTGIRGTALKWFASYLSNRSFSVKTDVLFSSSASLCCGVPQGSILGPVLFSLHVTTWISYNQAQAILPLKCTFSFSSPPLPRLQLVQNAAARLLKTCPDVSTLTLSFIHSTGFQSVIALI